MHVDFKDLVQKYLKFSINKLHIGYMLTSYTGYIESKIFC